MAVVTTTETAGTATPGDRMRRGQRARLVLVLGSLIAISPLTIDMYLPAMLAITRDLQTSSTAAQLTLTGTLIGLALGQLVIGPLSDAVGRRRPLIAGLAVHVVASLLCAAAPTILVLGGLRVLQGLGAAAAAVIAVAVLRDLFSGVAFAGLLSRLLLVMGAAPVLAPTLGGLVLNWTDWRGVFVTLALLGLVLLGVAMVGLPESHPPHRRRPATLRATARGYRALFRDRTYLALVAVAGLGLGAVFAYVAGSSFVLQEEFGLSEQEFAVVFGAGAAGLITGTQVNPRLLRRFPPERILVGALAGGVFAGATMVLLAAFDVGGLWGFLLPLWLVLAAAGLALPNAPALALTRHGEAAGTAAALLGATQFGLGALAAPAVGLLGGDRIALAAIITAVLATATVVMVFVIRGSRVTSVRVSPTPARM